MRSVNYNRVVNMICDLNSSCAHTHMVGKSVLDLYVGRGCGWAVAVSHVSRHHSAVGACAATNLRIMPRRLRFGMSTLFSSVAPVSGDVSLVRSHAVMASRSYVKPSDAQTGSVMISAVMAHAATHSVTCDDRKGR